MKPIMNEKLLVGQLKNGDTSALNKMIEAYSGYVRTVAKNFSRGTLSNEDIDELTADVFYKLYSRRNELDADIGLRPYLSAAVRNAVKNRFRKKAPYSEQLPADISELDIPLDFILYEQVERNEMMSCLTQGLSSLSEDEREIFIRFYFYGERSAKIAEKMNATENSVNTKLHRIRNKLKKFLIERGYDHA